MKRAWQWLALAGATLLQGCGASSYYWQAFTGQMEVRRLSRPVDEVIAAPDTAAEIRKRLEYARTARDYASTGLQLPDNRSYRLYADLKRRYIVWNVFAAPPLSLTLQTHCFPVAGCVTYRGFFAEAAAKDYADELRAQGLDVYMGGVPAYSTLGWFDDPLLNTFIRYPELEVARLIFHELAHQVVYAQGDSTFNESFATTVEEEGLRRWIVAHATPEQKAQYEVFSSRRKEMMALLRETREQLLAAYEQPGSPGAKLAAKQSIIEGLRARYAELKAAWGGFAGYDGWLLTDLNNAKLGSIATYSQEVPGFNALLRSEGGDLARFYARVKELAALPQEERTRRLEQLAATVALH